MHISTRSLNQRALTQRAMFALVFLSIVLGYFSVVVPQAYALDCGCEGGIRYRLTAMDEVNDFTCPSGTRTVVNDSWAAGGCSAVRTGNPGSFVSCQADATCNAPLQGTISVTANTGSASWTIVGPTTLGGAGSSQSYLSQPPGVYTIIWNSVSGYTSPGNDSQTLLPGGVLNFSGAYVLPTVNVYF